jgi:hypothetical protein
MSLSLVAGDIVDSGINANILSDLAHRFVPLIEVLKTGLNVLVALDELIDVFA